MVSSRPRMTVPIIGDTAAQPIEPKTYQPSGVSEVVRVTAGGTRPPFGSVWASAGTSAPTRITIASNARFATPRIPPSTFPKHQLRHSTRPLVGHHGRIVQ